MKNYLLINRALAAEKKLLSLFTALLFVGSMWADPTVLFHETFGEGSTSSTQAWDPANGSQTGVDAVMGNPGFTSSATEAKQSKQSDANNYASGAGASLMGNAGSDSKAVTAIYIVGPLVTTNCSDMVVSFAVKYGSVKGSYFSNLYYSTDNSDWTSVTISNGPTAANTWGVRTSTSTIPSAATLWFKIEYSLGKKGGNPYIDEFDLSGTYTAPTGPTVTLSPNNLTLNPTSVADQNITVNCTNFASAISSITTGLYSDEECVTPVTSGAWVTNINDNDANQVTFSVADNDGAQRQVWLKVTASDGTSTESAVLSITQKKAPLTTIQEIYDEATAIGSTAKEAVITFNSWVVSGTTTYNAYVTDGTKGFVININNHGYAVGDILTGTAYVNLKLTNGRATITDVNSGTITKNEGGVIAPVAVNINNLSGVNTGAPILVNNVTYNGTNLIDVNENAIKPYNELYSEMSFTSGKAYNVKGIYLQYSNTKEILPRSAADITEVPAASVSPDAIDFGTVGVGDDAPAAKTITITGTNLESALSIAALTNYDYAVTAGSLTPSEGSVNATVTITPKSGFTTAAGQKDETLTISGGGIANDVTVDITAVVKNKYTVTWNNNGNTSVISTVLDGDKPAFPVTPESCDATSTTFVGWATAAWSGKIENIIGKTVYTTADAMPAVEDDITYYAVFVNETEGEPVTKWVLTALDAVTEGVYALLTTDYKAFNGTINNSGHGTVTSDAFSFTNSEATSAPEGTCELTFTAVSDGFTMYNEDLGYLYASAASSGSLSWHEEENSYWYLANENWSYKLNSARLRSYNNATFRTYSANNGNVMVLAKKTTVPSKAYTDYMTTCPDDPTAIVNTEVEGKAVKVLRNGILLIEKNGHTYNAQGQLVK